MTPGLFDEPPGWEAARVRLEAMGWERIDAPDGSPLWWRRPGGRVCRDDVARAWLARHEAAEGDPCR